MPCCMQCIPAFLQQWPQHTAASQHVSKHATYKSPQHCAMPYADLHNTQPLLWMAQAFTEQCATVTDCDRVQVHAPANLKARWHPVNATLCMRHWMCTLRFAAALLVVRAARLGESPKTNHRVGVVHALQSSLLTAKQPSLFDACVSEHAYRHVACAGKAGSHSALHVCHVLQPSASCGCAVTLPQSTWWQQRGHAWRKLRGTATHGTGVSRTWVSPQGVANTTARHETNPQKQCTGVCQQWQYKNQDPHHRHPL